MATLTLELRLPSLETIAITASSTSHIARVLQGGGLKAYELHSLAAALAATEGHRGAFYDVGANIGVFSLCIASALKRHCFAFEPFEQAAEVLVQTAGRYGFPISVRRCAVAETSGTASFYLSARSDMSNSLNSTFRAHRGVLTVETVSLDDVIGDNEPSVIKVDTETTEPAVIRGALASLQRYKPILIIEILNSRIGVEISEILESMGYRAYEISASQQLNRIDRFLPSEGDGRNVLFSAVPLDPAFHDRLNRWRSVIAQL
jgi:FkbM family methyltransferase